MPKLLTFEAALEDAQDHMPEVSVLLGNGFSIDFNPAIFTYESLADEAVLSGLSVTKEELFEALSTSNFELVIERLRASAALEILYGGSPEIAKTMELDARVVRNGLADVLAARHPEKSHYLQPEEIRHAREFLANFKNVFTINYDLLLYWVIMAREYGGSVPLRDGFEWPTFKNRSRLVWKSSPSSPQRVFFLHGALHLFIEDHKLVKLSYGEDGPLVDALRTRLDNGEYPLVVTEGKREEKEARIDRSAYLRFGLRRFGQVNGALFIHGMSMSPNDDHILERIESENCNVKALYVGIHGRKRSASSRALIDRAEEIVRRRKKSGGKRLRLKFYRAESARVWRD